MNRTGITIPKPSKMYVWNPPSMSDYYDGMLCVIAKSKAEAIQLAIKARFPRKHWANITSWRKQTNQFVDELRNLKCTIKTRGAVWVFGGG